MALALNSLKSGPSFDLTSGLSLVRELERTLDSMTTQNVTLYINAILSFSGYYSFNHRIYLFDFIWAPKPNLSLVWITISGSEDRSIP